MTRPFNELRKDYLLDRWVVIATERGRRPTDFAEKERDAKKTVGDIQFRLRDKLKIVSIETKARIIRTYTFIG